MAPAAGPRHCLRGIVHHARLGGTHAVHGNGARDDTRGLGHVDGTTGGVGVEDLAELVCRLEAGGRIFFHALEDDALKCRVYAGVDLRRGDRKLVDLLERNGDGVVAVKGNAAGSALVHHHARE